MSIIMQIIDSRLILVFLSVYVNCESDHNFGLFIDSVQTNDYSIGEQNMDCVLNGCRDIQFSLPNMKFWEVWKDSDDSGNSEDAATDSRHWPNPPAIWGEGVIGQHSKNEHPTRSPVMFNPTNGPIITKLDKIVDILRPVSNHKSDDWLHSNTEPVLHKQKPESRYDKPDVYFDYDIKQKAVDYLNDKNIDKRNLKKLIIEENDENPEIVFKKQQKKPTIIIEEKLIPAVDEEDEEIEPKVEDQVIYKILKKSKPKPKPKKKPKEILIEEEDNEDNEDYEPEPQPVIYHKKSPKKEKMKEIYILANGHIEERLSDHSPFITTTTTVPTTTTTPVPTPAPTTTLKPTKKKRKIFVDIVERAPALEERDESEEEETEETEEVEEEEEKGQDYEGPDGPEGQTDDDEEAWGSALPETRVKPNRSKKQRLSSINPFSVLKRLRPPYRHPPQRPSHHPQPYPQHPYPPTHHTTSPHHTHHSTPGGMVPGGTFRMRFYMDGPKHRETDDSDY